MANAIRSLVLTPGVWYAPGASPPPPAQQRRQESAAVEMVRGVLLERFDAIMYDDGPVAQMLGDLHEHLKGSGWSGQEIVDLLRTELFPEAMKAPPGWDPEKVYVKKRRGLLRGCSDDRLHEFLETISPN